jgi:hypothetical protein
MIQLSNIINHGGPALTEMKQKRCFFPSFLFFVEDTALVDESVCTRLGILCVDNVGHILEPTTTTASISDGQDA